MTVAGMTALALGALLRNTAAAITTFVAVFLVIPTLTLQLPASSTDALRAVPTLQPRRRVDRRQFRYAPSVGPLDRIRRVVRVRRHRDRG